MDNRKLQIDRTEHQVAAVTGLAGKLSAQIEGVISSLRRFQSVLMAVVRNPDICAPSSADIDGGAVYVANENGQRRFINANETERIRKEWSGHFLLDLPRQTLQIRTGRTDKRAHLGSGPAHWGVIKVLMVGMSQPGVAFGYARFSRIRPGGSGIGDVTVLGRYVHSVRRVIGDNGRKSRYLHKTRVDLAESPTRWGYVFDDRYEYLVIAKCPSDRSKKNGQSIEPSTSDQEFDP